jgi:type VI secretion system protein ImpE
LKADELFRAGKLDEAIASLAAELRDQPSDVQRRTFLFELLCFSGAYDRAEKQLDILADRSKEAQMGTLVYRAALHAERLRQQMFLKGDFPRTPGSTAFTGTLNGKPFASMEDADPRIGPRLEVFAGGQYLWLPIEHVASVRMEAPKRLRDLLWAPAIVRTGPGFKGVELGEVLIPVLTPLAYENEDVQIRLGRVTEWVEGEDGSAVPAGQKLFSVDDEDVSILEIRELQVTPDGAANA